MKETVMKWVFMAAAAVSILAVGLICIFLFANGVPAIGKIGVADFLLGKTWKPGNNIYGIFPMIVGSVYVTAGAIIVGVPLGILCAVFLVWFCPKRLYKIIKPAVELLAGIPSIVYGGGGKGILTASILLGIMILPTIIGVSESNIRAVPMSYYEGSLGLGATHERSVFFAVLPAAKQGILAGVVLGIGRAVGETMAVVMIAGNQPVLPDSIFSGVRTMTANIVMEMGYATDLHREALLGTAVVLFVFILIINLSFSLLKRRAD